MSWYGFLLGLGYRKTDQDSNFTSKLLSEINRLLHIHPLRNQLLSSADRRVSRKVQWNSQGNAEKGGARRCEE